MRIKTDFNRIDRHGHVRLSELVVNGAAPFELLAGLEVVDFYQGEEHASGRVEFEPGVGWVGIVDWGSFVETAEAPAASPNLYLNEWAGPPSRWKYQITGATTNVPLYHRVSVATHIPAGTSVFRTTAGTTAVHYFVTRAPTLSFSLEGLEAVSIERDLTTLIGESRPDVPPAWMIHTAMYGASTHHG